MSVLLSAPWIRWYSGLRRLCAARPAFTNRRVGRLGVGLSGLLFVPMMAAGAPLVVAVEDDAAPWSMRDGKGYANDVVKAAFDAAGLPVTLAVVPYARCKDMVIKARAVACFNMAWVPELQGRVVFADKPLFSSKVQYFVGAEQAIEVAKPADLPKGTVLGVVNGFEYPASVYALRDQGVVRFDPSTSDDINLQKLALGRLKIALLVNIHDIHPVPLILAQAKVTGKVKYAFDAGVNDAYIGFSVRHPQGAEALKAFNRGYQAISGNGTLARLNDKWLRLSQEEMALYTTGR